MVQPEPDPDARTRELAAQHAGPTDWFEALYGEAEHGRAVVPWDRGGPQQLLVDWLDESDAASTGPGRLRALVVGSGPGADAALLAVRGFDVLGFDVSPTAVRLADRRHGDSGARFVAADLLDPPVAWDSSFDLVVEIYTVQSMPRDVRAVATASISRFVAPGGRLLVIGGIAGDDDWGEQGPPWPLTREEVEAFAGERLRVESLEQVVTPAGGRRWRAVFTRSPTNPT